jgi:enoyl-CoA hydratase/carnithine racemase
MSTIYDKKDKIAYLTINRPEALNAMDSTTYRELLKAIEDFKNDEHSWVLIITGAGDKAFSAGADLMSVVPSLTDSKTQKAPTVWFQDIFKPVIAAVNGICFGGAMEILLATDIRIAADNAVFGQREPKFGVMPSGGCTVRLPRQISWCHAMEMLLVADKITAQDAYRMGLVNRVVPLNELMPTAESIARRICENGPLAIRATKEAAIHSLSLPLDQALVLEFFMGERIFGTEDVQEGLRSFLEKRKPNFQGV